MQDWVLLRKCYKSFLLLIISQLLPAQCLWAEDQPSDMPKIEGDNAPPNSFFLPKRNPTRPRGYILSPLLSWALPGLDQWIEGQESYGALYLGVHLGGLAYGSHYQRRVDEYQNTSRYQNLSEEEKENLAVHGEMERKRDLGSQIFNGIRSISAYHAFRTAVATRRPYGSFTFLAKEETPSDIALAPFQFEYLTRMSTIIPLGIIATYAMYVTGSNFDDDKEYEKDSLTRSDLFYSGAISYNAGVHEEAWFRGWFMPIFMEWTESELWSNTITAVIFALAHLNDQNQRPWPQLALGWHLGYVTQKNNWTLSESIFIHAWWDVFALLGQYQIKRKNPNAVLPIIWAPPLQIYF